MNRASNRREAWQRVLHTLRESPGLGRLALVRFSSQFGDGMFQAALGGAILFNPERETDPVAIAAGFAVLLLPYSVIGPFAGALLDRWDRRPGAPVGERAPRALHPDHCGAAGRRRR